MKPRWSGCVLAAMVVQACGDAETSQRADAGSAVTAVLRWVGVVEETEVRVAALLGPGKARLFFCGDSKAYASWTRWFDIDFDSEHLEFEDDEWHIHAHLLQGVAGEVAHKGDERTFHAGPYPASTLTGLYEGKAACGRIGLIVTQVSEQDEPNAQGACTGATPEPSQPVELVTSGTDEIRVRTQAGEITTLQPAQLDPL